MIKDYFDKYGRQARLLPALLMLFPAFITIFAWTPAFYETAAGLVGLAVACGLLSALSHFVRARGRALEKILIAEWGGMPTTIWLRGRDRHLEYETKRRYYELFEKNVSTWDSAAIENEDGDPIKADNVYASATRWLLEQTRDSSRFPLVLAENISYGFRRNCLGIRPFAIGVGLCCMIFFAFLLFESPISDLTGKSTPQIGAGIATLLLLLWWIFAVNRAWVRDAGDAFARALLACCDRL